LTHNKIHRLEFWRTTGIISYDRLTETTLQKQAECNIKKIFY